MKTLSVLLALSLSGFAQPAIVAHRGASGYLPEHTLPAKALAFAMGADFLEQDVVLTKDDVPIILHDIHLDTTTDVAERFPDRRRQNGHFHALDFTLAEIKQLHVSERFNPKTGKPAFPKRFPLWTSSFSISSLEEELQLIAGLNQTTGRKVGVYPEIKQPKWHRQEGHDISPIVIAILQRYGYSKKTDPCILQCFEMEELERIRTDLHWQGRSLLLMGSGKDERCTPEGLAKLAKTVEGIGPSIGAVLNQEGIPTELIKEAHAAGLFVHPYTLRVDELPKWAPTASALLDALFIQAQADGIFTDFPDVASAWVRARPAQ